MADIVITTKPITREKLAKYFPDNHELVRLLESLARDITVHLPDIINPDSQTLEDTVEAVGLAHSLAAAAQGLALQALALSQQIAQQATESPPVLQAVVLADDQPPVAPQPLPDIPDDVYALLSALRDRLAVAERAIAELKEGPAP